MIRRHPWVWVLGSSALAFLAVLGACALHGWHAPSAPEIVLLLALAVGLGVLGGRARWAVLSERDRASIGGDRLARARSAGLSTTLIATAITSAGASIGATIGYFVLGPMSRIPASFIAGALFALIPLLYALAFALLQPHVLVGFDAVRVGARVVRLRDVRGAWAEGKTMVVSLEGGRTESVGMPSAALAESLVALVLARTAQSPPAHARLGRAGRSLEAWRRDLVTPNYREGVAPAEEAERVLWSAGASPDERVGAALVLASADARDRVRVAADACADPRVRAALQEVADDALTEDALRRLEA